MTCWLLRSRPLAVESRQSGKVAHDAAMETRRHVKYVFLAKKGFAIAIFF
jgi:hypothetical protein